MAKIGMDTQVVSSMGKEMQKLANQIDQTIVAQIDRLVAHIPADWNGKDANQFADWWKSQHRKNLKKVASDLHGLGQSALNNAKEQEQVSGR